MIQTVVKRDGTQELFDADKLNKWAEFAAEHSVNWSEIALRAYRKCYDGCTTKDLHKAMIDACVEKEDAKHLHMAGRLLLGSIYKDVFEEGRAPSLVAYYEKMVSQDLWEEMDYTLEELQELDLAIDHAKDETYNYTSLRQMMDKYFIKDQITDVSHETPQLMFMGIAMGNMQMQKERRVQDVIKLYQYLSDMKINAPSPFLSFLRTKHKGFASCCVFTSDDNAESLSVGDHIAYLMTCNSAGIGGYLKTRSIGDGVRNNTIEHMGKLPYLRVIEAAVHANLQGGRGGAATMYHSVLDPEIMDLLSLKNPMTVVEKQVRRIDHALTMNKQFAEHVAKGLDWMLISYADAPDLHEAMFSEDTEKFRELYFQYLDSDKPKKLIKARDIAIKALSEAVATGRYYNFFADEVNRHTPFKEPIYSSNLCLEIALPTKAYKDMQDLYRYNSEGEIGLCSLGSIVAGRVSEEEYEEVAYYTVLMIDNVISHMHYPFPSLEYSAKARRSIGVGVTNFAHDMAKRGLSFTTQEGKKYIHKYAEMHSYYLHRASLRLAKERGVCEWIHKTKYPEGWLPIDTYNKGADEIVAVDLKYDWEALRKDIIITGGLRNSVLEAIMPVESSSQLTNTTNSIYPIRNLKVIKTSGTNKNILVAPDADTLGDRYDIAWDIDRKHLIDLYALFQKFTGQAISADLYIKFDNKDRKVPTRELLQEFLYMVKVGLKTRYYYNSASGVVERKEPEVVESVGCDSGGCTL